MATIHFDQKPRLPPEQDIGGLTDIGPGRSKIVSNSLLGRLEIPLGVLALANARCHPSSARHGCRDLVRRALAFGIKRLPEHVDQSFASAVTNGRAQTPADADRAQATT